MGNIQPLAYLLTPELREEFFQIQRRLSLYQLSWMLAMRRGIRTYSSLGRVKHGYDRVMETEQLQLQEHGYVQLDEGGNLWSLTDKGNMALSHWLPDLLVEIQEATLATIPKASETPT